MATYPPEVRDLAEAARRLLDGVVPGVVQSLDESAKLIGYIYGPGYKGVVCTLILSRKGVKLGIVRGAELPDPKQLMQGSGKVHRLKLTGAAILVFRASSTFQAAPAA